MIKNLSFVGQTTIFGKGFYLKFEEKIQFKHKNKELVSDTRDMLQFVWGNVFKLSIAPLDDYNVNILKDQSKYENDGAFSNVVFDETKRQCRLANERNVHEYLHSIIDNQKPMVDQLLNNNNHINSNINNNNNSNNNGNNKAAYAVTMESQRRNNSIQSITGMDLGFEKKNDRIGMIENINQFDLKQFETTPQSLGYFIVFFRFFQKNDSNNNNNDNNNEDDRYGKIEEIFYKYNENKNNNNILIENVYQMNDNNNTYCIVISSFSLQLSFKLQYDFGTFLYDPQASNDTINTSILAGNNRSSHTNGGDGKRIVLERNSLVLFCFVLFCLQSVILCVSFFVDCFLTLCKNL